MAGGFVGYRDGVGYTIVAVGVKVGSKGIEVAVGKGAMVGAGMNSGVQAARVSVIKAMIVFVFTMSPAAFVPLYA